MKKLLIVLLCFYFGNVRALEYSDYSLFSDFTDKEVKSDELTDVKVERRYKYYKLVRENGPYESENIYNDEYSYVDKDDYIYTLESDYLFEKPDDIQGRVITTHTLYHYLKADDITYVKLYNGSNGDFYYSNFNVVYKDNNINYDIVYKNADSSLIKGYGELELRFDKKIDVRYLNISFSMKSSVNSRADLYMTLGNDRLRVGNARYIFWNDITRDIIFKGINMDTYNEAFVDYYSDDFFETKPTIHYLDKVIKYTYKDILYRKYKFLKEYSDDYLVEKTGDYIYKDENMYKDYYAYRKRKIIENSLSRPIDNLVLNVNDESFKFKNKKNDNMVYKILNDSIEKQRINWKPSFLADNTILNNKKNLVCDVNGLKDKNIIVYYFSYILIIIVILILVLSKLYKKYIKSAKV